VWRSTHFVSVGVANCHDLAYGCRVSDTEADSCVRVHSAAVL